MIQTLRILPTPLLLSIILLFAAGSSSVAAQTQKNIGVSCDKTETDSKDEKCPDPKKRSSLKTVKLTPQIRKEDLEKQVEFNIKALYPFLTSSGVAN